MGRPVVEGGGQVSSHYFGRVMQSQRNVSSVRSSASPSRRGFLKASAAVAGVMGVGSMILRGAPASTSANSKINLAVVGCGGQGRGDMKGLISNGARLVALCDTDEKMIDEA